MHQHPDVMAGVLVGGRSLRMGCAKALLPHPQARTFVEHVVGVARRIVPDVVLLGSLSPLPPALRGLPVFPDARPHGGPLAGLCSALSAASGRWVLLLACDLGRLGPEVLLRLLRLLPQATPQTDAVAYARDGGAAVYEACCALYHPRILPAARRELLDGRASLQALLGAVRVRALVPDGGEARQLSNVNTPEDLARLANDFPASVKGEADDR